MNYKECIKNTIKTKNIYKKNKKKKKSEIYMMYRMINRNKYMIFKKISNINWVLKLPANKKKKIWSKKKI